MNFIKGIFSFLILLVLTIIGIVFIIAGLGESNYVLMGVGVLFLFPFLRKVYRRKFSTTNKKTTGGTMGFKSIFTKGVALAASGKCRRHSQKASSYARQAMSNFRSAKSKKGDQKIDAMLDGMSQLANSVLEVSDSVTPVAAMNAVSALLAENIEKIINEGNDKVITSLK